jgi:tRNA(adenine34) deaminase
MDQPKSQGPDGDSATEPNADAESMKEALILAQKAEAEEEVPIGAVVVHAGKIVGRGYNRREQDQDPLSHAELTAIAEAAKSLGSWRLLECTLFVTLEPCPMCLGACQQSRLKRVVFGALDPKGGALSLGYRLHEDARTHHRFEVRQLESDSLKQECSTLLSQFFSRRRKSHSGEQK